jgi:hypothetical protein
VGKRFARIIGVGGGSSGRLALDANSFGNGKLMISIQKLTSEMNEKVKPGSVGPSSFER